ncbi:OmpA family protein [Jannaschia rubra]|uniref:Inner membrane lipoprotein YiaD n=1 Tax=Jannaschia rubra TaxID=282197 RepID=A0A0M6XS82_9RHOB|nr:OmpA family protein [Jannaschia rubra]CTQ33522.1 Inner membrane lipoprotein YiaD precursor [Jannaschia rubra]SFG03162.1 Outer membrane protein OmpA [Jannaschia rubra]
MTLIKSPLAIALAGSLVLAGCVDATTGEPNRTRSGVLIGAGLGAATGALAGSGSRADEIAAGAVAGGLIGGAVGSRLDRQAADLRNQLGDDRITINNTGSQLIVTMPQDILFATDSANLRPDLQGDIRALAGNLQQYPDTTVQVIGHTDSDGSAAYNQDLSERRARAVAGVLLEQGVSSARIVPIGRGESQPIASNQTAQGKQQNRRVEIVITPNR